MSIVAGVFSETQLVNIQVKADEIWQDRIQKADLNAEVGVAQALLANQTAKITPIEGRKDLSVEIAWVNACEIDDQECVPCTFDSTELSTNKNTYTLDICREAGFKVDDGAFRDNMFDPEEVIANGFIAADKALSEYLAVQAVNWLNLNKGINEVTVGKGIVVGNDTYVPTHLWDAGLMAYFARVAQINRFNSPYLLSGNQLFESVWNAEKEYGNADGKGNKTKFGAFPMYFDLINIDAVNTPDLITYMLSKGAYAIANKTYFPTSMIKYMDRHVWSMNSRFLPGIRFDVEYTNDCDSCATGTLPAPQLHYFKLTVNAGMFLNPVGCEEDRTGILTFICGTGE